MPQSDIKRLRHQLRHARRIMPASHRQRAARRAARFLRQWPYLGHCQRIACYLAVNGEFPTNDILQTLRQLGKRVYLPILAPDHDQPLRFQRITNQQHLICNRFGIPEPIPVRHWQIDPRQLDLVITPLVGFDRFGGRLGMGGGFYDRSFAFVKDRRLPMRPFMLGLAFAKQEVARLELQPWDVPLDAVLTENGIRPSQR